MDIEEFKIPIDKKASLVSIVCDKFKNHSTRKETDHSLSELHELLRTLGIETGNEYVQNRKSAEAATILGKGKLEEIADAAADEGSGILVFDFELTASQMRNIKNITGLDVIDRCSVILEIFALHAQTAEAKIQIEISRLEYMLPRLTSMWTHFSKMKGGIGMKGEGEQQLELDRRIVRKKIERHKRQLKEVVKSRVEQRKKRQNKAVTAALVGYTNAGKSSVMNKLCKVNVLAEDKLFATLDSTYRMLNPDTKPPMILIDTVGFIQNLPSTLVEGFKTTLESAIEADLLIIICDISDENYEKHIEVTEAVLAELNIEDKEKIIVFNKKDKLKTSFEHKIKMRNFKDSFLISAHDEDDIVNLKSYIIDYFLKKQETFDVFLPYSEGDAHSKVMANTNIINQESHEQGIFYRLRVPGFIFNRLGLKTFILSPDNPDYARLKKKNPNF
jgi:GTP-binding protein HflX